MKLAGYRRSAHTVLLTGLAASVLGVGKRKVGSSFMQSCVSVKSLYTLRPVLYTRCGGYILVLPARSSQPSALSSSKCTSALGFSHSKLLVKELSLINSLCLCRSCSTTLESQTLDRQTLAKISASSRKTATLICELASTAGCDTSANVPLFHSRAPVVHSRARVRDLKDAKSKGRHSGPGKR